MFGLSLPDNTAKNKDAKNGKNNFIIFISLVCDFLQFKLY
jgi:hypothetical protein